MQKVFVAEGIVGSHNDRDVAGRLLQEHPDAGLGASHGIIEDSGTECSRDGNGPVRRASVRNEHFDQRARIGLAPN